MGDPTVEPLSLSMPPHVLAVTMTVTDALFPEQRTEASGVKVPMNRWRQWDGICEILNAYKPLNVLMVIVAMSLN